MATLISVLSRSEDLEDSIFRLLDPETYELFDGSARLALALNACEISFDHARALRTLVRAELMTSAISLLRPQGESVVRAMWLLYAADEKQVAKLATPLSPESLKVANKLPMFSEMIAALEGKAPPAAVEMVTQFKEMQAPSLNSFVHEGHTSATAACFGLSGATHSPDRHHL